MTMARLFRAGMLLCVLPLAASMTHGAEAFAAAARPQPTPEQVATIKAWYLQIARQLESKKQYPAAALPRREQGTVVILFRLDRQAQLVSSRILRTSDSATLDNAGLALVRQAQPFPPPPPLANLQFDVPIRYRVDRPLLPRCTLVNRLLGPCTSQ
jgi:periplasmic protein TonB